VISALVIAAPCVSRIVPFIWPVVSCAESELTNAKANNKNSKNDLFMGEAPSGGGLWIMSA